MVLSVYGFLCPLWNLGPRHRILSKVLEELDEHSALVGTVPEGEHDSTMLHTVSDILGGICPTLKTNLMYLDKVSSVLLSLPATNTFLLFVEEEDYI